MLYGERAPCSSGSVFVHMPSEVVL